MQIAMIQNDIIPLEQLEPAYCDRGVYFGDGVYEVIRSYDGRIFALEEHLARFARSLSGISMSTVDIDQIRSRVKKAFEAADIADAMIYFHITRGSGFRSHNCNDRIEPNFFLTVTELKEDEKAKSKGITVSTHPDWRWQRCDIKSLNLLANVLALKDAAKKGCDEAILVDNAGLITEGASSAFFAIFGQNLRTAPLTANILPSVTRKYVLKAADNIGLQIVEESMKPQQAGDADELFIASTTKDIVPVVKFDAQNISDRKPGKVTKSLIEQFQTFAR